jgi:hypothetical protein
MRSAKIKGTFGFPAVSLLHRKEYSMAGKGKIHWHPAFIQAMQQELFEYLDSLEFISEHQLTAEPLLIDLMIIKKTKNVVLNKNIAAIFRNDNILEYKSPDDYLSVNDFYKVCAYANLYAAISPDVDPADITLTFVTSRYPQKFIRHLREIRAYTVQEITPGVSIITGDFWSMQIIEAQKLPEAENLWLSSLRNGLRAQSLCTILKSGEKQGRREYIRALLDVLIRANPETFMEGLNMARSYPTLEEVFVEAGLDTRWKDLGRMEGREEIARNALVEGLPLQIVQKITGLDMETLENLAAQAQG